MGTTKYADCVLCGDEIRDDHEAAILDHSGDLAHAKCREGHEIPDADDQATLDDLT